ncbi:MAG: ATP synthase F1 subunit gamma [candidate division Zixibacteria bacterium]|nr:ATP synthase F1 subunit gamma [candidate division Zixibacteria bacterium]
MASLRDIKRRIVSVESTQQITKAMEMVAAAKLRRAQMRVESSRPYGRKMQQMLESLAGAASGLNHPLFEERKIASTLLVVIAADRGLCGSYNSNIMRAAMQYLKESPKDSIKLGLVGKKSCDFFKKKPFPIAFTIPQTGGKADMTMVRSLANDITGSFENGDVDEVRLLYTQFISMTKHKLTVDKFLPIEKPAGSDETVQTNYIFEPSAEEIFTSLVPRYCVTKILTALLESFASEFGSRMISMSNASKNAKEMIEHLTLVRNKARQASITSELLDIVGGAEALK